MRPSWRHRALERADEAAHAPSTAGATAASGTACNARRERRRLRRAAGAKARRVVVARIEIAPVVEGQGAAAWRAAARRRSLRDGA